MNHADTYKVIIERVTEPFSLEGDPPIVEVFHHTEGGDLPPGEQTGEGTTFVQVPIEAIHPDGSYDKAAIENAVRSRMSEDGTVVWQT